MRLVITAIFSLFCAGAQAQQIDCTQFSAAIENDMKFMSMGVMADKGESGEAALASAAASNIQSNLLLMQAAKCKLPTEPVSSSYYVSNVLECNIKRKYGTEAEKKAACDKTKWERKK